LKKPKPLSASPRSAAVQDIKEEQQQELAPWSPSKASDDFWVNKMRQRLEKDEAARQGARKVDSLTERLSTLDLADENAAATNLETVSNMDRTKPAVPSKLALEVKMDEMGSPASIKTESTAVGPEPANPFVESPKNILALKDEERVPLVRKTTFLEPEMTPHTDHSSLISSRKSTPLHPANVLLQQRSPNLDALMQELNGISDTLNDLPLPPTPENTQKEMVKEEPLLQESGTMTLRCIVDGTEKTLPLSSWHKVVLRHGNRWIIQGSRWVRMVIREDELHKDDPMRITKNIMVLEGIDDATKNHWLSVWDDNYICHGCALENERRVHLLVKKDDLKQSTPKKAASAVNGRNSPARPSYASPARPPFCSPVVRKGRGYMQPTSASKAKDKHSVVVPSREPEVPSPLPAKAARTSRPSSPARPPPQVKKERPQSPLVAASPTRARPSPRPVVKKMNVAKPASHLTPSRDETLAFKPRKNLMRTP
jgi:hypothetical protein